MARLHLEKLGVIGTAFSCFGCLGFPVVIGILSATGARWLLQAQYLLPILLVSLTFGLGSLYQTYRSHHHRFPLILAGIGGAAVLATEIYFHLTHHHLYLVGYPGFALFAAAFLWDFRLQRECQPFPREGMDKLRS